MTKLESIRKIEVWADWQGLVGPRKMGTLTAQPVRGQEIFSFAYHENWLNTKFTHVLDPKLQFYRGEQYNSSNQGNFGLFLDSSPDRWGRLLQKRRAAILARKKKERDPRLLESDYLLGVYDEHRSGGLRFKINPDGPFLNDDHDFSAPPMASLRELETAAWAIENEKSLPASEEEKWLQMLIAPGGSLGGARPKASVFDDRTRELWIAKFPSRYDHFNTGLWEFLIYKLAKASGIKMPEALIKKFSRQHTFLTKRFDRYKGKRIHFASAMTMLGKNDGADASDGTSYLEIAEFLMNSGARPEEDLEELWRRIVFSICISNTDDHLRNHGFLLTAKGWQLSPAFDLNPNPDGEGLKLNISESDNSQNLELALSVASYFRLTKQRAEKILHKVVLAVREWKTLARSLKASKSEIQTMERAFRIVN